VDEKKLLKYAVDYLSKYDSSRNNLVSVLKRKILRLNLTNFEKKKLIDIIESIILKLEKINITGESRDYLVIGFLDGKISVAADQLNVFDILNANKLVIGQSAIDKIQEVYAS